MLSGVLGEIEKPYVSSSGLEHNIGVLTGHFPGREKRKDSSCSLSDIINFQAPYCRKDLPQSK
jgi:hypothetical protein